MSGSKTRNIHVEYEFAIKGCNDKSSITYKFNGDGYGFNNFVDRNTALKYLVKGVLVIEVRMKTVKCPPAFIADNPSTHITLQSLFMDEESADIVFYIGGENLEDKVSDQGNKSSGAKFYSRRLSFTKRSAPQLTGQQEENEATKATKFYAHRLISKKAAPLLAELSASDESPSHVEIPNLSSAAFKAMLLYIYGCEIPKFGEDMSLTKEIIEVADKYEITHLKLEAEAVYVASIEMTVDNVLENLQYADSMYCAFLKEEVMDFIAKNAAVLLQKGTLKDAPEGVFHDVLAAIARRDVESGVDKKDRMENKFGTLRISELRREACEKGLEVDGSRETLIATLKGADNDNGGNPDKNED